MKLTKGLLERLIKEEIEEAKYGGNPNYKRSRSGMRDMTYGEKWSPGPKKIDSFKERAIPTFNWIKSMDAWLTKVAANSKMVESGYQYEPVSTDVTTVINSAIENSSFSQSEYDLIVSTIEEINKKIEDITLHPIGGPKYQEMVLNYRRPLLLFTIGRSDFVRGEE
jgi:hypothetical protein